MTSFQETLREGDVVAERYRLTEELGRGGSSIVWAADHVVTGKPVALKVLTRSGSTRSERFHREATIATRLRHAAVVPVHDLFQLDDDTVVMVMDLLEGETLSTRLARGRLGAPEATFVLTAIAEALHAAHAEGIVHRDLKPENVFLTSDGRVLVLDFGIAKWRGADSTRLTETGALVGTPLYMAPEQVFGERDVDGSADVWSLGVVAFECLAGRRPFEGDNAGQVFKAISQSPPPKLASVARGLPRELTSLVDAMLTRDRRRRATLDRVRASLATFHAPPRRARGATGIVVAFTVVTVAGAWAARLSLGSPATIASSVDVSSSPAKTQSETSIAASDGGVSAPPVSPAESPAITVGPRARAERSAAPGQPGSASKPATNRSAGVPEPMPGNLHPITPY